MLISYEILSFLVVIIGLGMLYRREHQIVKIESKGEISLGWIRIHFMTLLSFGAVFTISQILTYRTIEIEKFPTYFTSLTLSLLVLYGSYLMGGRVFYQSTKTLIKQFHYNPSQAFYEKPIINNELERIQEEITFYVEQYTLTGNNMPKAEREKYDSLLQQKKLYQQRNAINSVFMNKKEKLKSFGIRFLHILTSFYTLVIMTFLIALVIIKIISDFYVGDTFKLEKLLEGNYMLQSWWFRIFFVANMFGLLYLHSLKEKKGIAHNDDEKMSRAYYCDHLSMSKSIALAGNLCFITFLYTVLWPNIVKMNGNCVFECKLIPSLQVVEDLIMNIETKFVILISLPMFVIQALISMALAFIKEEKVTNENSVKNN